MKANQTPDGIATAKRSPQKNSVVFIHSALDEAELSPVDFRVLCHIARRGVCFEKAEGIAKVCKVKRDTVFAALNRLEERQMIQRVRRHRQPTEITVTPLSEWKAAPPKTVAKSTRASKSQSPPNGTQGRRNQSPPNGTQRLPNGGVLRYQTRGHISISLEGDPKEGNPTLSPTEDHVIEDHQTPNPISGTPSPAPAKLPKRRLLDLTDEELAAQRKQEKEEHAERDRAEQERQAYKARRAAVLRIARQAA